MSRNCRTLFLKKKTKNKRKETLSAALRPVSRALADFLRHVQKTYGADDARARTSSSYITIVQFD